MFRSSSTLISRVSSHWSRGGRSGVKRIEVKPMRGSDVDVISRMILET